MKESAALAAGLGADVVDAVVSSGQLAATRLLRPSLRVEGHLALTRISASQPPPARLALDGASGRSSEGDGALGWWLVLGLALGLLLGWRRPWSWLSRRRRPPGAGAPDGVLPPPPRWPRIPHARLHDATYLRRMLEAERLSDRQGDESPPGP